MLIMPAMAAPLSTAASLDTRERILRAAERLIAQGGVEGASTKAIAEAAGVRQGLFHYYFSSKEALLIELLKRQVAAFQAESEARRPELAAEGLPRLFADAMDALATEPGAFRLRAELMQLGHTSAALQVEVAQLLRTAREQLARNLAAVRRADAPNERDRAAATALKGAMDGLAQQKLLDPQLDIAAAAEALLSMTQAYLTGRSSG